MSKKSKSVFNRKLYQIQNTKEWLSTFFPLKVLKCPQFLAVIFSSSHNFLPMRNIKSMPVSFIGNLYLAINLASTKINLVFFTVFFILSCLIIRIVNNMDNQSEQSLISLGTCTNMFCNSGPDQTYCFKTSYTYNPVFFCIKDTCCVINNKL